MARVYYDPFLAPGFSERLLLVSSDPLVIRKLSELHDQGLHAAVLEAVLTALPAPMHDEYVRLFAGDPGGRTAFSFARTAVPTIAERISTAAADHTARFFDAIHA